MTQRIPSSFKLALAFTAIYVVWGSTYLAIRVALESIPPFLMMGGRSLVAGTILILWSRLRGDASMRREHLPSLFIIGASFFLVGHGLLGWAQQYVSSGLASILVASEVLWIVLIESFVTKDSRVGVRGIAGLALGFVGLVILVASTKGIDASGNDTLASFAVIVGAISWGGGAVYSRVAKLPKSPLLAAGAELVIGGALLVLSGFLLGEFRALDIGAVSTRSLLGWLYLILFGSVLTFSAYIWLLGQTSATRISTHTYVNPVIAVFLGWLVASETISTALIVASVVILGSVYLVLKDHKYSKPSAEGPDVVRSANVAPEQQIETPGLRPGVRGALTPRVVIAARATPAGSTTFSDERGIGPSISHPLPDFPPHTTCRTSPSMRSVRTFDRMMSR